MKPAVFLDRDGTVIEEVGYLNRLDRIAFFPWSVDAIRVLNHAGFLVVIVTNQAGVARGYFDEALVRDAHALIDRRVREGGARIDAYYYCPHHPDAAVEAYREACDCRKPRPGMIHRAAREHGIDVGALVRRRRPMARRADGAGGGREDGAGAHGLRRSRKRRSPTARPPTSSPTT